MTQIKKITDKQGNDIYLRTHTKAVVDDNGYTAESRLQAMQDEINQTQLEVGAVPSDLTPNEGSSNWVTSGGLYNELNVGDANVEIDLSELTVYQTIPNPTNWVTNNSNYKRYAVFVEVTPNQLYKITNSSEHFSIYAFLTTDSHVNTTNVSYADGCTREDLPSGSSVFATAPLDAAYMYVLTKYDDEDIDVSIIAYNKKSIKEYIENIDSVPTKNSSNLVTSDGVYNFSPTMEKTDTLYTIYMDARDYQLNTSTWLARIGGHIVIPCVEGDSFKIYNEATGYGGFWGWLTDAYVQPTSASVIPYVSGTGRYWLDKQTELIVSAPKDAAYLCVCPKDGGGSSYWKIEHTYRTLIANGFEPKADKEYVDDELLKAKYNLVQFDKTWVTNDSNVIYATKEGDDTVIHIVTATSLKRCGIDISDINVGESVYFSFSYVNQDDISHPAQIVIGVGETLSSTYIDVGTYKKGFFFTKTSASQNYLYTPANSYYANYTITLKDFKVYKATGFAELNTRVTNLEGHDFYPSSYIPIKEGYERYMSITGTQGSTIYGDYFVQGFAENAKINIYNLETKTLVQEVTLPTFGNTRFHANTISFSGTKYDSGDDFPLLYICAGYVNTNNPTVSEVYVVRIVGESGSYTSELIQTINLAFSTWTEFVCDPVRNRAWINGSGIARYICVAIPDIAESEVTIDANTTIIDKFDTKSFVLGTTTKSSGQGRFFYHNRVYYVSGVPSYTGEGVEALYVVVDNVLTHSTEAVVPLMNFGLTGEPEGCFIWKDEFYVAYRGSIVKLIQN